MSLVAGREGARRDQRRWIGWEWSGGRTVPTSDAHGQKVNGSWKGQIFRMWTFVQYRRNQGSKNTLWVKFCLILTPMTLAGISSQFQEPHPGGGSREDFMKKWRIWGWFCMCVLFKITHSDFILYMNTLCIEYTCHIYIFTWYGNNAKIEVSRMCKHQRCCAHREGSLSKLSNLCSRDLA